MLKRITLSDTNNEYQLEYYNSIGLLFKNHIFLNKNNKLVEFDIEQIKRLYFKKERDLTQNYMWAIIACTLFVVTISLNRLETLYTYTGIFLSVALLAYAIMKNSYQYRIILFTNHSHIFSIPVSTQYKEEACELLSRAKYKIKNNKNYLKAS